MAAKEASKNSPKGESSTAQQKSRGTRQLKKEVVDLRTLLIHCAKAVATDDRLLASELIKKVRQHSSRVDGECCQRLAFYFVNGLEARLAGTGSQLFHKMLAKRISEDDVLKVYNFYLAVCPFNRASYTFANQTFMETSAGHSRVHIVDFGVCTGFQWPSLIQLFGEQGVPPRLRITGIEVPRPGFSPLENIERAGKLLADYANMYKVPFQYQGIYSRYEDIQIEDLNIDEDEVLIINCMYQMKNLGDETVAMNSARDRVLKIMRRMNPKVFIFGILNGSYSSPFFVTCFKELLFHYSSLFDMLDMSAPRDNEERKLLEGGMLGREILNIVACEGADRIEKPETYQQWQARCHKAGFEQLSLDPAIMKLVLWMKKEFYHEDFVADEDNGWLLQGWKGRVLYAVSKWKVNESCADQ
ncbi:scarecrow-like protein 9 [Miscanthus floridulus]|uniref:scarecrow-like protein 9 n=1 Tax=Miscanthus floridulus TaxID=154761 RepID=UPI00345A0B8F